MFIIEPNQSIIICLLGEYLCNITALCGVAAFAATLACLSRKGEGNSSGYSKDKG